MSSGNALHVYSADLLDDLVNSGKNYTNHYQNKNCNKNGKGNGDNKNNNKKNVDPTEAKKIMRNKAYWARMNKIQEESERKVREQLEAIRTRKEQ